MRDDRTPTVRPVSAAPDRGPPPADPSDTRPHWAGAGVLVRSALALDGRRTYALDPGPSGVPRMYVVPAKAVDLERYVNRKVDVFGTTYTRRELSKPYMVVHGHPAEPSYCGRVVGGARRSPRGVWRWPPLPLL